MINNQIKYLVIVFAVAILFGCKKTETTKIDDIGVDKKVSENVGFEQISSDYSGLDFSNTLEYNRDFNIYTYRNFYNGGGVAIGDINNDSLPDLYFTINMSTNKLFLNKGDMKFEDITESAGVGGKRSWSTGVSMADVNGDGFLDIYVCNSGDLDKNNKQNEFFINNGDMTFTEVGHEWGIDDKGYSTHAVFFDYDKDGDLDIYLLNNSYQAIGSFNLKNNIRNQRDAEGGDKLMRNDGTRFTDVSKEAGIYGSVIGFGLGVTVGDINNDNWPDIYVSNDFFERDYIYINNQNGTFTEDLPNRMKSISAASMGADMADINNDALPDIFVTEMLPSSNRRLKTKTTFENWDKYNLNLESDYYHQFTRNMMQISQSDHNYVELGRQMGVSATDWSWGALIADFDNDSWKDLFIANGIAQDLTDQDFLNYITDEAVVKSMIKDNKVDYSKLIDAIPSEKLSNFMYKNMNGQSFTNVADTWGLAEPSFSNGSAYGDLDLDGDLDLVVNNVNMQAFLYRNNVTGKNWIQFSLQGKDKNTFAIGAKIYTYSDTQIQYHEYNPIKGFQSSMDYSAHIGLGNSKVDSVKIIWPDHQFTILKNPEINRRHYVSWQNATGNFVKLSAIKSNIFTKLDETKILNAIHQENTYVDFDKDRLLFHMRSTFGPKMAIADLNGDKLDDVVICGSSKQATGIYLQSSDGSFKYSSSIDLQNDKNAEDLDVSLLDIDRDGDLDLYIARGGSEFGAASSEIKDDIFINDGKGNFTLEKNRFPTSGFLLNNVVESIDYDGDGDDDLLVIENSKPGFYGVPGSGFLLENEKGIWKDVTESKAPELKNIGLSNDAKWLDINGDKLLDFIVVGDYMAPEIFIQESGKWSKKTEEYGLSNYKGWWNTIEIGDLDGDGDLDFILGNHGENSRFRGDDMHPVCMHVNDFDRNGTAEHLICIYEGEKSYPLALKHDIVAQLPMLKKRFVKYNEFASTTIEDLFSDEEMKGMITYKANYFKSAAFINNGNKFIVQELPWSAQSTSIYAMKLIDYDKDGILDLLAGGNLYHVKPEVGRYDASNGMMMKGLGNGQFQTIDHLQAGFSVDGEIRDLEIINSKAHGQLIVVARNNNSVQLFKIN